MKLYLLLAGAVIAQPAYAQEVVLKCFTESDMKIYNPHGKGGVIGGPSPREYTIRTDGNSITVQLDDGEAVPGRELRITPHSLSYCGTQIGTPCDVTRDEVKSDGFNYSNRASRTSISAGGTFHFDFFVMTTNARMKTGVTVQENGQCEEEGMAALRRLMNPDSKPAAAERPAERSAAQSAVADAAAERAARDRARAEREARYEADMAEYKRLTREREKAIKAAEDQKLANERAAQAAGQRAAEAQRRYEAELARHKAEVERIRLENERRQKGLSGS